jgi:hypothetical protein
VAQLKGLLNKQGEVQVNVQNNYIGNDVLEYIKSLSTDNLIQKIQAIDVSSDD